jgi:hypothetical protein
MNTVLEKLCDIKGCQGGTIHQMAREVKSIKRFRKCVFFTFGNKEFCINNFGLVIEIKGNKPSGFIKDSDLVKWFLEQLDAKVDKKSSKLYRFK